MNTQLNKTVKNIATHTRSFANVLQKEWADTGFEQNLPIDLVLDMVNTIIKQEIGSVAVSFSEPAPVSKPALTAAASVTLPVSNTVSNTVSNNVSNKGKQITLQMRPFLMR